MHHNIHQLYTDVVGQWKKSTVVMCWQSTQCKGQNPYLMAVFLWSPSKMDDIHVDGHISMLSQKLQELQKLMRAHASMYIGGWERFAQQNLQTPIVSCWNSFSASSLEGMSTVSPIMLVYSVYTVNLIQYRPKSDQGLIKPPCRGMQRS